MFADDKSIENFQQLFFEFKKYLELQKEYTKLELTEKLTILLSTLIMIVILIILGMVALFYLLFALAYVLEPLVGGLMASFAIIAGINILIMALVIIFRKQLSDLAYKFCRRIVRTAFSAGAGKLIHCGAAGNNSGILLFKHRRKIGIIAGRHVRGKTL